MTFHANYVLSTCGTSLLINRRSDDDRQLVNRHTNARTRAAVAQQSPEDALWHGLKRAVP